MNEQHHHAVVSDSVLKKSRLEFPEQRQDWAEGGVGAMYLMWMFPKIGVFPPDHPWINRVFHYKPSILGYHYFRKHPYTRCVSEFKLCIAYELQANEANHFGDELLLWATIGNCCVQRWPMRTKTYFWSWLTWLKSNLLYIPSHYYLMISYIQYPIPLKTKNLPHQKKKNKSQKSPDGCTLFGLGIHSSTGKPLERGDDVTLGAPRSCTKRSRWSARSYVSRGLDMAICPSQTRRIWWRALKWWMK